MRKYSVAAATTAPTIMPTSAEMSSPHQVPSDTRRPTSQPRKAAMVRNEPCAKFSTPMSP